MKRFISLLKLFYLFSLMGIQMFGNLVTMIPIFEAELVTKRKLITNEDVIDAITIGRCGPGAAIVNTIAFLGNRIGGFWGGVFATLGFCFFLFVVILAISFSIDTFLNNEIIKHFLKGVSTCISVMIINSMIDFGKKTLKSKICVLVFIITLLLNITTEIPIVCYLIFCIFLLVFIKAEKICRDILEQKKGSLVEYNGEMLAIQTIAKREGLKDAKTLKKYYEQTQDIDKAIELYNMKKQEVKDSKIEYKGERKFLKEIARDEDIAETTLTRYLKKYGDIDKAVFMAKVQIKYKK